MPFWLVDRVSLQTRKEIAAVAARSGVLVDTRSRGEFLDDSMPWRRLRRWSAPWGGTLDFVYLPSWDRYRNGSRAAEQEHTRVLHLVNGLFIPIVDIEPAFHAQGDPLSLFPFRRFGHYNERGNRIVAATILRFLAGP